MSYCYIELVRSTSLDSTLGIFASSAALTAATTSAATAGGVSKTYTSTMNTEPTLVNSLSPSGARRSEL